MEQITNKLLDIIDNKTHDGVLTLEVLEKNKIMLTSEVCKTIWKLIDDGILYVRETADFSAERPGNQRSKWGEQVNFNQRIHLKKIDLLKEISDSYNYHGLKIIVLNDISSAVSSKCVKTKEEGIKWFNSLYDNSFSYEFIIV